MRRALPLTALIAAALALPAVASDGKSQGPDTSANAGHPEPSAPWRIVQRYCTDCHNAEDWAGGVAFDTMTQDAVADDARVWESALR